MMQTEHRKQFLAILFQSLKENTFVKLTLTKYAGEEIGLKKILVRLVEIKQKDYLSFVFRYQIKDITKNYPISEGLRQIEKFLRSNFLFGNLFTIKQDIFIKDNQKTKSTLLFNKPTFRNAGSKKHDREKKRYVSKEKNNYLRLLKITNESGNIREKQGDKYKQINKFIEILDHAFCHSLIKGKKEISVVDMGAGKGYLTFAIYDYFRKANICAAVTGVERQENLVAEANRIAHEASFDNLRFIHGDIQTHPLYNVDILLVLHACDTATDDAIYKAITARASLIICAPCCHKQIRPQIKSPDELREVLKFGIFLERQAEMITDTLRTLYLELYGYHTRVFEFISLEHTNKNIMILATKHGKKIDTDIIKSKIAKIKNFFGIENHYLEELLR